MNNDNKEKVVGFPAADEQMLFNYLQKTGQLDSFESAKKILKYGQIDLIDIALGNISNCRNKPPTAYDNTNNVDKESDHETQSSAFNKIIHQPPKLGLQILLVILPKELRRLIPEDLREEFNEMLCNGHSKRYCDFWYYTQVIKSIGPIIANRFGKVASEVKKVIKQ